MFPNTLRANPQLPDGLCALQNGLLPFAKILTSCQNGLVKRILVKNFYFFWRKAPTSGTCLAMFLLEIK